MEKRFKILGLLLSALTLFSSAWVWNSPFKKHKDKNEIRCEVIIDASACEVFEYLGNSSNAKKWSIFVKQITPLNSAKVKDGSIGSIRRCFAFENNIYWDEIITEVKPCLKRILSIYNLQNFPMTADGLLTEQQYVPIDSNKSKLIFKLYFKNNDIDILDLVKTKIASYEIYDIFNKNINNVKHNIESNRNYSNAR